MKVHIHTLGCKVNQFESQAMEVLFTSHGHEITPDETGCDAIIINTCAVTAESVRKSRQAIRHLKSQSPDAIIGICGCWSQAEPKKAEELGADVIFGNGDHETFINEIEKACTSHEKVNDVDDVFKRRSFEVLPSGSPASRTRALLKIEDGCVNFCTYCIIPYTRGPIRSLPMDEAKSEARKLATEGYKEIVLTGIEIASYGRDLKDGTTLADVVCEVAGCAPECRIRLGSLEPRVVTEEFCRKLSQHQNICPHFHLSLQSGCDATLARMKRKYDTARFYESVELLRKYFPNCGITADLIVGFPSETDEEFSETLEFIKKCAFSSMHIFPYSLRRGTAAEKLPDHLDKSVKQARAKIAAKVAHECQEEFLNAQIGTVCEVLFEQESDGMWEGHSKNYVLVKAHGDDLHNHVCKVLITGVQGGVLLGDLTL